MTDPELIQLLAAKAMGWEIHGVSAHRPGSRQVPHAWLWRRAGGVRLMLYDGKGNREWNPLAVQADLDELLFALHVRGLDVSAGATARDTCEAAAAAIVAAGPTESPQPQGSDEA